MSGFFNMKHHVWSKPWHITLDITSVLAFLHLSKTYPNKSYNEHTLQYSKKNGIRMHIKYEITILNKFNSSKEQIRSSNKNEK